MTEGTRQPEGADVGDHVDFRDSVFHGPVLGKGVQHVYVGPRPPAAWPCQVGVIPGRAGCFQDRAEVARLRQALSGGGTAVVGQVLAGMGGVGKTQLAADYARHAQETGVVDVLVWISAGNAVAVAWGYAQAAVEVLGADPADQQAAARAFHAWLEPKAGAEPCRWLVVLDDVADPADLRGWWPPASPHGQTLATTRRRDAALTDGGRQLIEVGVFTEAESLAYLTATLAAHDRQESAGQLATLAADLGHLPLALSQAAAYLVDSGQSVAAYRDLLADRTRTLADAAPDVLPGDQTTTVAAAWSLSIDRADILRPAKLARPMLQLAAFLDANGIPQDVLTSNPALDYLAQHRTSPGTAPAGEPAPVSPQEAVLALRALHRLSLIDHTPTTPHQAVRIHQLVQRATRDTLTLHQHNTTAQTAADALLAAWPAIERDTDLAQTLRANTTALTETAEDALYQPGAHAVLFRTGRSLGEAGQVIAARDHYQHLTDTITSRLGEDHPATLNTRGNLARWRGQAGDAAGAVTALAELLADRIRVLGEDHPHTLNTRHDLARWRGEAGDAAGAATATAELLADRIRVLGEDHPATLNTRGNLARWRGEAGNAAGAVTALAELLADRIRVLGEDHPHTLTTRHDLAWWRGAAGDTSGAATALADLLPDMVRVLGEGHPATLTARSNLAHWRGKAGEGGGASGNVCS
ncbi:tetratricopeptide repeat protein [Streptomyces sp. MUSC 125]|uniref:tetratricopeptide repeat protein n=1 Tax=Streptomyces sp. MUSC 125 TaxID=1428624 RepID=UPI00099BE241|nr:tetratricopeptide repeat protein [Streptomyces sp. MUSC 125]